MNFSEQEQSLHTFVDENFKSNEINSSYNEFSNNANEMLFSTEHIDTAEFSNQLSNNQQETERKTSLGNDAFRKYLSCVVASLTVGAMVVAPVITTVPVNQPAITIVVESEYVSYDSYECYLDIDNSDDELIGATITSQEGSSKTTSVEKQNEGYRLYFDDLTPETEYDLSVVDNEGAEHFVDKFKTDDFITIEEASNNQRKLNLHKDFPTDSGFNVKLLSADGRDFSSNIISNYQSETYNGYIQLDGLYADEYTLQFELYPRTTNDTATTETGNNNITNDIKVYKKTIELGSLQNLNLSAEFQHNVTPTEQGNQIHITYLSGDFDNYYVTEVLITHKTNEKFYYFAEFDFDNNRNISIFVSNQMETGEYNVIIRGRFEASNFSLFNEIWKGSLTVPEIFNM